MKFFYYQAFSIVILYPLAAQSQFWEGIESPKKFYDSIFSVKSSILPDLVESAGLKSISPTNNSEIINQHALNVSKDHGKSSRPIGKDPNQLQTIHYSGADDAALMLRLEAMIKEIANSSKFIMKYLYAPIEENIDSKDINQYFSRAIKMDASLFELYVMVEYYGANACLVQDFLTPSSQTQSKSQSFSHLKPLLSICTQSQLPTREISRHHPTIEYFYPTKFEFESDEDDNAPYKTSINNYSTNASQRYQPDRDDTSDMKYSDSIKIGCSSDDKKVLGASEDDGENDGIDPSTNEMIDKEIKDYMEQLENKKIMMASISKIKETVARKKSSTDMTQSTYTADKDHSPDGLKGSKILALGEILANDLKSGQISQKALQTFAFEDQKMLSSVLDEKQWKGNYFQSIKNISQDRPNLSIKGTIGKSDDYTIRHTLDPSHLERFKQTKHQSFISKRSPTNHPADNGRLKYSLRSKSQSTSQYSPSSLSKLAKRSLNILPIRISTELAENVDRKLNCPIEKVNGLRVTPFSTKFKKSSPKLSPVAERHSSAVGLKHNNANGTRMTAPKKVSDPIAKNIGKPSEMKKHSFLKRKSPTYTISNKNVNGKTRSGLP